MAKFTAASERPSLSLQRPSLDSRALDPQVTSYTARVGRFSHASPSTFKNPEDSRRHNSRPTRSVISRDRSSSRARCAAWIEPSRSDDGNSLSFQQGSGAATRAKILRLRRASPSQGKITAASSALPTKKKLPSPFNSLSPARTSSRQPLTDDSELLQTSSANIPGTDKSPPSRRKSSAWRALRFLHAGTGATDNGAGGFRGRLEAIRILKSTASSSAPVPSLGLGDRRGTGLLGAARAYGGKQAFADPEA